MIPYTHKKTGRQYLLLAHGVDATNKRNGSPVVVYCPDDSQNTIFVSDLFEFEEKFEATE